MPRSLFLLLLCALCVEIAPAQTAPQDSPPPAPQPPAPADIDEDLSPAPIPDHRAGRQLKYVLSIVNGEPLGDPAAHFTPDFLDFIPPAELEQTIQQIRAEVYKNKPIDAISITPPPEGRDDTISAILAAKGVDARLSVFIILDDKDGRITGLRFNPAGGMDGASVDAMEVSRAEFEKALGELQGNVSLAAYELRPKDAAHPKKDYALLPVMAKNEDRALAIGSTFKLYVLGALAEDIASGAAAWDEQLPIREAVKSLPSGRMQLEEEGNAFPLSRYAELMISISDNTATDHLITRLTRDRVQTYAAALNDNRAQNEPFLTTREAFVLKLHPDPDVLKRYREADDTAQRAMLDSEFAGQAPNVQRAKDWVRPTAIDSVEWFASARQCCQALSRLHELEQQEGMQPLGKALRTNPGLALNRKVWKSIAYKGGSEPGVLNMSWLLERDDGRWYVLSFGENDAEKPINQQEFTRICGMALSRLAREDRSTAEPEKPAPARPVVDDGK